MNVNISFVFTSIVEVLVNRSLGDVDVLDQFEPFRLGCRDLESSRIGFLQLDGLRGSSCVDNSV